MEKVNSHFQRRWDLPLCHLGVMGVSGSISGRWVLVPGPPLPSSLKFFWVEESTVEVLCVVGEEESTRAAFGKSVL